MEQWYIFLGIGFFAQLIDGCLGMGYGLISNSFLVFFGVPVVTATASIHFSEIFTTFFSGISHLSLKNVDKQLLKKLSISGAIGGGIGAYLLSSLNLSYIKIFVNIYLLFLGIYILVKFYKKFEKPTKGKITVLGFIGGMMDAIGGGGWGPIVTSNLIAKGHSPQKTVGAVCTSEFFVTLVQSFVFFFCLSEYEKYFKIIICLLIGGIIAAPIAALINTKTSHQKLILWISALIIFTNILSILKFFNLV